MPRAKDMTTVDIPAALRDLIARHRRHDRQALHEIIEDAFFFWEEAGAWRYAAPSRPSQLS